jgi:hypothetical protein
MKYRETALHLFSPVVVLVDCAPPVDIWADCAPSTCVRRKIISDEKMDATAAPLKCRSHILSKRVNKCQFVVFHPFGGEEKGGEYPEAFP